MKNLPFLGDFTWNYLNQAWMGFTKVKHKSVKCWKLLSSVIFLWIIFFFRLAQETSKEDVKNRESVYILLDLIVNASPFLSMDLLESCFPYTLLRNSYHNVHKLSYNALATTTNAAWDENKTLKNYYAYWFCKYIIHSLFLTTSDASRRGSNSWEVVRFSTTTNTTE